MSPGAPHRIDPNAGRYQVPLAGRYTPMSATPSPVKSPLSGTSPALPHVVVAWLRVNHVAVSGRKTVTSLLPSPSKSPGTMRRMAGRPAWVTVNVWPAMVNDPLRAFVEVLAVAA